MIRALEIVMVNLGFTSEAASQINNFYKIIAKIKIYKRVKLVFYSSYPRSVYNNFRKLVLRACYTVPLDILKNTNHCISTDLSVFDCIPITVCPIYSLTAGIILFKNCEFGFFFISISFIVFHQSRGTFTGVSEEGTPNLPFAKAA